MRNKIGHSKDDVDGGKKSVATLQEQIKNLQGQLKDAEANGATAANLFAQLQQFKADLAKQEDSKVVLQNQFAQANSDY